MDVKKISVGIAVLLIILWGGYLLGGILHSDGAGDAAIREQLETLGRNQQFLTTKLDGLGKDLAESQRRIESVEGRITNAEAGVDEVAGKLADSQIALTESAGLITANERILRAVRERAKVKTGKPAP